ncbi:MAG TPA: TSUP family transporter [Burkholderiales bacterium]|nr:TSUP family transporter [Burkholderiales bacterium]
MDPVSTNFIQLDLFNVLFLLGVGFVGGMVSGFIGSGGAFVLTPAMMSMGAPGIVAVASNICHKFPKALVGAMKRAKYGQVDVKLGIIMGLSAEAGILYGAHIQESVKRSFGDAGSNLYVSAAFVVVLAIVGGYVLWDAVRIYRRGEQHAEEKLTKLARWVQSLNIPGTMVYFPSIKARVSFLVTIPMGFATGMLAATIAVGGFIGVPSMMYVLGVPSLMASATELVIAFIMGVGGTIKYGWSGFVDIRLAMIILAGSLFGIQLGAIGTTYVKPYMVKVVMGTIMIIVLVSRAIVIPVYLSELQMISPLEPATITILKKVSFYVMVLALVTGAFIVLRALIGGMRSHRLELAAAAAVAPTLAAPAPTRLSPVGRFDKVLLATDGSEFSAGATRVALEMSKKCNAELTTMSMVLIGADAEGNPVEILEKAEAEAQEVLARVKAEAAQRGQDTRTELRQGSQPYKEIVRLADDRRADVIVMGRRGRRGLARMMVGESTRNVIGYADCSVLVVPKAAVVWSRRILLAIDGSRHSDMAAVVASELARKCNLPVAVISVLRPQFDEARRAEGKAAVERVRAALERDGVSVEAAVLEGDPAEQITGYASGQDADLIVLGSHGRTGLGRLLLGSVTEKVIGQADCPVMAVKA